MAIHQNSAATAARIAGSVLVMRNYDMEGNLHLVAIEDSANHLAPLTHERIIECGFFNLDTAACSTH